MEFIMSLFLTLKMLHTKFGKGYRKFMKRFKRTADADGRQPKEIGKSGL